jgi:hypothetical protein
MIESKRYFNGLNHRFSASLSYICEGRRFPSGISQGINHFF